jgi:hypothetical protein
VSVGDLDGRGSARRANVGLVAQVVGVLELRVLRGVGDGVFLRARIRILVSSSPSGVSFVVVSAVDALGAAVHAARDRDRHAVALPGG